MNRFRVILILIFLSHVYLIFAQQTSFVYGTVTDTSGYTIGFASVTIPGTKFGTTANRSGQFELNVPTGKNTITASCIGYESRSYLVNTEAAQKLKLDMVLTEALEKVDEVKVISRADQSGTLQRIDAKVLSNVPNASGNIENVIKQLPGVASNNELSSQYSVRGGSFDENIVYVNDIEIFRPILIRSGQQEGLSFVNSDMVGSLKFSAGGFDASYGDKMSSVLDVTYKKPSMTGGSFSGSMLGGTGFFEGLSANKKLKVLLGVRYKTTQYLVSSLDTKGEYKPSFADVQTNVTYDIAPKLEISVLGNYCQNKYDFFPVNRDIEFGTYQLPLKAHIYYEGGESDAYRNAMGAVTLNYHHADDYALKLIASAYTNNEKETFDLLGEYNISQIDKSSSQGKDSSVKIGVGGFLNHARNFLDVNIITVSHIGYINFEKNRLKWGITLQHESITDRLNEWEYIDSANYKFPYSPTGIVLNNTTFANNTLYSDRITSFLQHTWTIGTSAGEILINTGIRSNYWTYNQQTLFAPRFSISYKPESQRNLLLYAATGIYHQPAFYKEMRDPQGVINRNIKAQQSVHYVLGSDYVFYALSRPFKLTAELYYKNFSNLVPYRVDNVRSIYAGKNMAKGYAAGLDFKINGEFVKGTESWMSLSLLQTKENIAGDSYVAKTTRNEVLVDTTMYPGYYSRPTDQLVNVNLYFQDYIPRFPTYKVHMSIHYGSSLPVTFPLTNRWDNVYKLLPSYKRVDIGVSKLLKGEEAPSGWAFLNVFKEVWISAELFNAIGVNNVASYMWIKSVSNYDGMPGYFAVPNYLTSRRLNFKLSASF